MKVISENLITVVTADSENANYPADNVLTEEQTKKWKAVAGVDTATLTLTVGPGANAVGIMNTNAESVSGVITDPNAITFPDTTWDGTTWVVVNGSPTFTLEAQENASAAWGTFDQIDAVFTLALTLSAATGSTIEAGIVQAGAVLEFGNPLYQNFVEGLDDSKSFSEELAGGEDYYFQIGTRRTFECTINTTRDPFFHTFVIDLAKSIGRSPRIWNLAGGTDMKFVVYAKFYRMPTGPHLTDTYSRLTFGLIEAM